MLVEVDRSSVHAGDDVRSHEHWTEVDPAWTVEELLASVQPDVDVQGGSTWICCWGGEPFAVWCSRDRRVRTWRPEVRTVADLGGGPRLFFDYWSTADPDWLLAAVERGALADRWALRQQWDDVLRAREEAEWRERARTSSDRLLTPEAVAALEGFGAALDPHGEGYCRAVLGEEEWRVSVVGSWLSLVSPHGYTGSADSRLAAETWLVAAVGAAWLAATGTVRDLPPAVEPVHRSGQWVVPVAHGTLRMRGRDDALAAAAYASMSVRQVVGLLRDGVLVAPARRRWWRRGS
ncbi:hypothetical protein EV189_0088 [Motilibacter rhizosphaerae]|uniref:Uncharacterized protein n=1 Tax=Motilibacter rhizosphaerae TaxID=598652 RepID=A0A4Q7NVG2_9ACTN|nr:hypothetical protein [Motilibacter rhizosphaerae]RZS90858.1 hypothetical protein EV189_0088 [Motilibacter rhizosphaerae]